MYIPSCASSESWVQASWLWVRDVTGSGDRAEGKQHHRDEVKSSPQRLQIAEGEEATEEDHSRFIANLQSLRQNIVILIFLNCWFCMMTAFLCSWMWYKFCVQGVIGEEVENYCAILHWLISSVHRKWHYYGLVLFLRGIFHASCSMLRPVRCQVFASFFVCCHNVQKNSLYLIETFRHFQKQNCRINLVLDLSK